MAAHVADSPAEVHLLDGALGTELGRRGILTRGALFSAAALLDGGGRAALREVHRAYVEAGAGVITPATLPTSPRPPPAPRLRSPLPALPPPPGRPAPEAPA